MALASLLTGSNIGNREKYLATAASIISQQVGTLLHVSSIYETDAWGKKEQDAYLNQALLIETTLTPLRLINQLLDIEKQMGRLRTKEVWGPRTIDIDILLYDTIALDLPGLKLPHPRLPDRMFALMPLCDINAAAIYPGLNMTIAKLKEICTDPLKVKVYSHAV